jgi:hypothetical protein
MAALLQKFVSELDSPSTPLEVKKQLVMKYLPA